MNLVCSVQLVSVDEDISLKMDRSELQKSWFVDLKRLIIFAHFIKTMLSCRIAHHFAFCYDLSILNALIEDVKSQLLGRNFGFGNSIQLL